MAARPTRRERRTIEADIVAKEAEIQVELRGANRPEIEARLRREREDLGNELTDERDYENSRNVQ